jgi:hypothetical protein
MRLANLHSTTYGPAVSDAEARSGHFFSVKLRWPEGRTE